MTRPFAHLHCHTTFSMLDGANRLPDLIKKVKANRWTDQGAAPALTPQKAPKAPAEAEAPAEAPAEGGEAS